MRNLTISVDEEIARWARIAAAERDTSVSRFISELLRERMGHEQAYESAMRSNLARQPGRVSKGRGYPRRNELYDRPILSGIRRRRSTRPAMRRCALTEP
jgi:hypothetical protein